jgi:hypothetical protein
MVDTETYGGRCPECGLRMLQKDGGGSDLNFAFDACPHCGFAYGTGPLAEGGGWGVCGQVRVWKAIFAHYGVRSRSELIRLLNLSREPGRPEDPDGVWPSLFDYECAGRTS